MNHTNLFSIDVDAHLKKAATHTFGSPSHYPVELVRSALRRNAKKVDIEISRNRIRIQDNGAGLDIISIETLSRLLDPAQPFRVKEEAVEALQTRSGFGLLALFAASPEKILVENVSVSGKTRILFQGGQLKKSGTCRLNIGTRITIFTSTFRDTRREKYILNVYCQSVQKDIHLNNRLISKQPLLFNQIAYFKISHSKYIQFGEIGIPRTGDFCRLRLLDQQIPHRHITLPPKNGFIFDAAVEYTGEITKNFLNHLTEYAFHLYQWLCRHHSAAPPHTRERIEELIFTHYRLTEGSQLLKHFSPFKVFQSSNTLSLSQVTCESASSPIFAVPRRKEQLHYNTTGKTVLSLTREQADFLINRQKLPITFLSPVFQKKKRFPKLLYSMKKGFKHFTIHLFTPYKKKILNLNQLNPSEQFFIHILNQYLSQHEESLLSHVPVTQVVMIPSRGPFPSILHKKGEKSHLLLIRRRHSLVQKAVRAIQIDPGNVELFIPLLCYYNVVKI